MTADQLQLITAAVDGELSATDARALRLLIASSAEAGALFAQLKADSDRVRALPRVAPPADLQAKILARLATARLATATPAPRVKSKPLAEPSHTASRSRRVPVWLQVGMAASVFLCLAAASFAFFTGQATPKGGVAKNHWSNALPAPQDGPTTVPSPTTPQPERPAPGAVVRIDVPPVPPAPTPHIVPPEAVAVAPEPRTVPAPDFNFGFPVLPKLPPFERVELRVPFLRPVADLSREDIGQELLDELHRDPAFKFDLFVRDTARGVEVFQHAAKASGLTMFADAATLDKLKKKQAHAIVIYTESLTPAELVALFAKLSTEDTKFSPKVCDSLHASPVVRSEELELKAILGLDVGLFKRPLVNGTSGGAGQGGDSKNVSAGTIDKVVKSVSKPGEKPAVLLTWQTTQPNIARTNPAMSAELKQYLAKRGERKPNAVPAVIVIRPVG